MFASYYKYLYIKVRSKIYTQHFEFYFDIKKKKIEKFVIYSNFYIREFFLNIAPKILKSINYTFFYILYMYIYKRVIYMYYSCTNK